MKYSIKLTHDKAEGFIKVIDNFCHQYLGVYLGSFHGNITSRYAVCSKTVNSQEHGTKGYTIGVMVDLDIVGKYSHITLKVYCNDIGGCFAGIPIDISNKNWPTFAEGVIDGFHYLGKTQIKNYDKSMDSELLANTDN
jgi:hypothetical protein